MPQDDSIIVILRSHITPTNLIDGFKIGIPCQIRIDAHTTIDTFIDTIFLNNKRHIGFIAINGQIINSCVILQEGDEVQVFSLITGG